MKLFKSTISEQAWNPGTQPLVSICCITYNHAKYIRDCLNGFLMQEVNFSCEIIINDDCSTDGTIDIIKEYTSRFPSLISPVLQEENQFSKGIHGIFSTFTFSIAKGKYIAMCEGDDYWTDPLKLQKQVNFLESHSDYSFICGGFISKDTQNKKNTIVIATKNKEEEDTRDGFEITFERTKNEWITKTLTLLFRRDCLNLNVLNLYKYQRDVHIIYHLMKAGKGYYMKEVLGVYNIHNNGIHSGADDFERKNIRYLVYEELYSRNQSNYLRYKFFQSTLFILRFKMKDGNYAFPKSRLSLIKQALKLASSKEEYMRLLKTLMRNYVLNPLLQA